MIITCGRELESMRRWGGGGEKTNRRRNVIEWGLSLLVSSPKPEQDWYSFGVKSPSSDEERTFDPFTIQSYNPLPRARSLLSKAVVPGRDGDYCRVQVLSSLATCSHRARSAQGPQLYDVQIYHDTPKKNQKICQRIAILFRIWWGA